MHLPCKAMWHLRALSIYRAVPALCVTGDESSASATGSFIIHYRLIAPPWHLLLNFWAGQLYLTQLSKLCNTP